MNRDEAKKLLPVIQAFAEGKDVQLRTFGLEAWLNSSDPAFNPMHEWRIKPEPFECWITSCDDGGRCSHASKQAAESYAKSRLPDIYTIHHMREVI